MSALQRSAFILCCLLFSCGPTVAPTTCQTDAECGEGLSCDDGTCVAALAPDAGGACRSDETRPCGPPAVGICKPGVRRCIGGVFETSCFGAVTAGTESCNGLDDDCDGETDEGLTSTYSADRDGDGFGSRTEQVTACQAPTGYVSNASDCNDSSAIINPSRAERCETSGVDDDCDGMADEGCGCSNPGQSQACCAGRGTQTCTATDGGAFLSACSVLATTEVCNGVDDDCDGQTDEEFAVSLDGGAVSLSDGGVVQLDGGCEVGVGACFRAGAAQCTGGVLGCSVVAGSPSPETCNGSDDDCDGETDEASANLCMVSGQVCGAGVCACPTGTSVCGASCEALGTSCAVGTGACRREGTTQCTGGTVGCSAMAGTPGTEVCNAIDDDCDGQTDEGVTIACLADPDNDGYATDMNAVQLCPDTARAAFGNCPLNYVAPTASVGIDCAPSDGQRYRQLATRADQDADTYCTGTQATECVGAAAPTGKRFASACAATDDCNDTSATVYVIRTVRPDADGDTHCLATTTGACVGATAPVGTRFAETCSATVDCNDADGAKYRFLSVMADGDGDGICAGSPFNQCTGANPQPGFRLSTDCSPFGGPPPIDCNDANANEFFLMTVRTDADGDGWCTGTSFSQCTGNSAKPGTRAANQCAGNDCRDSNASATSTCNVTVTSQTRIKACGFGIAGTQTLAFDWACPAGFQATGSVFARLNSTTQITDPQVLAPTVVGTNSTTWMNFTCRTAAVGEDQWQLRVDCQAQ